MDLKEKYLKHTTGNEPLLAQVKENGNGTATTKVYDYDNYKIREEFHNSFREAIRDLTKRGFYQKK
jgi:hypothetical protein